MGVGVESSKLVRHPMEEPRPVTKGLWNRRYPPPKDWMRVVLRSVASYFPILHPASWVGIFRGAFLLLSSSVPRFTLGSPGLWVRDPSISGSALGAKDVCFPSSSRGSAHLPRVHSLSSHVLYWLPSLHVTQAPPSTPMGSGWWSTGDWVCSWQCLS
jgi:hypothetical protein